MKLNKTALKRLLKKENMTLKELHSKLAENGIEVAYTYLARVLAVQNDLSVNLSLVYAIAGVLNIDVNAITENENSTPAPSVYTLKKPDENLVLKIENLALKIELLEARVSALENENRD